MLIGDPAERAARAALKRAKVLKFLADEVWSSGPLIGQVAGLAARPATDRLLLAMERDGLLRRAEAPAPPGGRGPVLWGITPHGLASCPAADPLRPAFEPSKIAISRLSHTLALQRARVACEAAGWIGWERQRQPAPEAAAPGALVPDALAVTPRGNRVAIEIELTVKWAKKYPKLILRHLQAIESRKWMGVFYVAPASVAASLTRIVGEIKALPGGIPFDPARRANFRVVVDSDFPNKRE